MDPLHRLVLLTFTTREAAMAVGIPPDTLQQRIKQGRIALIARPGVGTGNRRGFSVADIYRLRLMEALTADTGLSLTAAGMLVSLLRYSDVTHPGDSLHLDGDTWHPQTWAPEWRNRSLASPFYLLARRLLAPGYGDTEGWRVAVAGGDRPLEDALRTLPSPPRESFIEASLDEGRPRVAAAIVVNMTRELLIVDRVLAMLRPDDAAVEEESGDA